ncbi:MAG: undecaprenyldiphospho-muramoylpentapeptide beta-N-acetylglucosaminyltransferase [Ignavibacteria bacterium]|nr:undecaprenyldiphospho-muramoylpentapeptide beta-N-acetylglucosaminyltransferase [Ignavibacteria bacterium]
MSNQNKYRILFAGGGTGGHLFPAIAVAQKIREMKPEADILFVGTKSKIEGRVVPQMGFNFRSIWIKGFSRKFNVENLLFPIKLFVSIVQSLLISLKFKPIVSVGSGGYVSGPALWGAHMMGSQIVLLEQNSFPGKTTKLLEKYAKEIHLSFESSLKYFRNTEKCFVTGNPIRVNIKLTDKKIALNQYSLTEVKKTIAILGGSLGARSLNEAVVSSLSELLNNNVQIIWQAGNNYLGEFKKYESENVKVFGFIDDIGSIYSAADLIIARAGATTIAEITNLGLASMLVPSPNVAENHQYYNAKSLSEKNATILLEDKNLSEKFSSEVIRILNDEVILFSLRIESKKLGKSNAAELIAQRVISLAEVN